MSAQMRKTDTDSFSMASRASRNSGGRKTPRFSLRNFFCRRPSARRSLRSLTSSTEPEARSVSSFQPSQSQSIDTRDASISGLSTEDVIHPRKGRDTMECPLCLAHHPKESFPHIMTCHHRSCRECLRQYLRIEISESRVNIACPECAEKFHPNDIRLILDDDVMMTKYEDFMLRRILVSDPDTRWCPAPDCGYAVIATGCASCPKIRCDREGCNTYFCYHCKQYWHPNQTCDAARAERTSNLRSSSVSFSHDSNNHPDIKPCPRCAAFISKLDDGSCNHMTCAVCGAEFCWLCMQEISDLHYLSPSGCTFWGKKPWSRKKKILWQLGILAGAPIGIGLVAGIAVPAMVIGIPVWVGRKLHAKYEFSSRHKRNLIIVGGVTGAIVISPVLAALAVGIGVPILLAYVYGVVPISLCRSGGCGVTTTNSGGIHFDFEEGNDAPGAVPGTYNAPGDNHQVETQSYRGANPSIGPSIGEMSIAMTNSLSASGSHIDRVGTIRDEIETDHDSASNRAIAGVSLSGSLSGSVGPGPSGYQRRLEVHADVANGPHDLAAQKRASLSSESANFSLDAKSGTVSFGGDDVSTKALAGSLCTRDKDNVSAIIPPLEVQVDVTGSSIHYRHNSGTVHPSPDDHLQSKPSSSPTSSRSVNFVGEEIIHYTAPGKRYKKQSLSVGDSINERTEKPVHDLSCYVDEEGFANTPAPETSPCCSVSMDSMPSRSLSGCGAVGLTQVESDRPSPFSLQRAPRDSTSSESTSTETVSIVQETSRATIREGTCSDRVDARLGLYSKVSFESDGATQEQSSDSSSASSSRALCAKRSESETDEGSMSSA